MRWVIDEYYANFMCPRERKNSVDEFQYMPLAVRASKGIYFDPWICYRIFPPWTFVFLIIIL